ncbi:MAG TPA: hypothetical protein VI543_03745 [Sulfuricaulis sp.]|jgi:uncharacterized protein YxeA|nr:hypothetical protein [Sulfuricaulis sp.]
MNKWLKILIGVVVVIVIAVSAVFFMTSGMVDTADAFFKAIKQQDIAKARGYLSEDFKASTDENALKAFLSKGAMLNFKEASWSDRQISGGRGELNGAITTETGGVVPIKMMLVKENDAWKIYAIQKPTAGLQSDDAAPTVPGKAEQVTLVKQSIHDFIVSIEQKNMGHFRSKVSQLWQKQHTTEQLNQAFKPIMDSGANWPVLDSFQPVISSEARVDENGVLLIAGHYPTQPSQVNFEQKFIYEDVSWRLIGFKIQAK